MTSAGQPWPHADHPASGNEAPAARSVPLPAPPSAATFPLHVSDDRRRLLDADGRPFLIQGDAAWSLIANLTDEEAVVYLDDRQRKGFNTLIVSLVEHRFSVDPPRDRYGNEPFLDTGRMDSPNDVYMDRAERILDACAERGFAVILAPAYLGYRHPAPGFTDHAEGWYDEVVATGADGCRRYGEYLGRRFGRFRNLLWCMGGDWDPDQARAGLDAIAAGIRSQGVTTPFTAHVRPETSPVEAFAGSDWLDLNPTYTYEVVHRGLIRDWQRDPVWPFYLIESTYEGEHNASDLQIRRQAWWSVLCGANGHCMGNNPIWLFWDGWREALDFPASIAMARWGAFFRELPWADLVPDLHHRLVKAGIGEARGLDRLTAAVTTDRRVAVAYMPDPRAIEVDTGVLAGERVQVSWFDPATGRRRPGGRLATGGRVWLAPPFDEDAALVLESQ
jgi:hypothetical protein